MTQERDHIGPDPLAWIDRLQEVNRGSQFAPHAKTRIHDRLATLRQELAMIELVAESERLGLYD